MFGKNQIFIYKIITFLEVLRGFPRQKQPYDRNYILHLIYLLLYTVLNHYYAIISIRFDFDEFESLCRLFCAAVRWYDGQFHSCMLRCCVCLVLYNSDLQRPSSLSGSSYSSRLSFVKCKRDFSFVVVFCVNNELLIINAWITFSFAYSKTYIDKRSFDVSSGGHETKYCFLATIWMQENNELHFSYHLTHQNSAYR